MIKKFSKENPYIHGLILLDCWEPQVHAHFCKDKYYINLIEKIKNIQFNWIVNSASRLHIDFSDIAMANTIKLCNYNDNHPIIQNLI